MFVCKPTMHVKVRYSDEHTSTAYLETVMADNRMFVRVGAGVRTPNRILVDPACDRERDVSKCPIWWDLKVEAEAVLRREVTKVAGANVGRNKRLRWQSDGLRAAQMQLPEWFGIQGPAVGDTSGITMNVLVKQTFNTIWVEATTENFEYLYAVLKHQMAQPLPPSAAAADDEVASEGGGE